MLRRALSLLAPLALLSLGACGSGDPGETRVTVIVDTDADAKSIAPLVDLASAQGLVRFDARGEIVPGLAERWHVSDDGTSYIFRLGEARWGDGEEVDAESVAAALTRILRKPGPQLDETLGAIDEIVPMTDEVVEIRLSTPRPHLLQLLAQPGFALRRREAGTGPFALGAQGEEADGEALHFVREAERARSDTPDIERVHLETAEARDAVARFVAGKSELVLGGTFDDLPIAQGAPVPRGSLRYDPAAGLFGLVPRRADGFAADSELRRLLSRAIDRKALIEALGVPALAPRATVLQEGIDLDALPDQPDWLAQPLADRQGALAAAARRMIGRTDDDEPARLSVALPDGPGGKILFDRLAQDWGALGFDVVRAGPEEADFLLIDEIAPSESAAWMVRRFSCRRVAVCSKEADTLAEEARHAVLLAQRRAILADVGQRIDDAQLFIPLAAPVRWSLVASAVTGFAENRFAIHPLTDLKQPLAGAAQ
ncbi:ABC transporter substrate-binding protein [Sphingomicrobium nitratireducens]|uniref:ABC transporter substrate-binding protein n=1 Tax=Sphingomicrobium nitratireducens TaxID=2964666 RepID=UPI0022408D9B|nr:ABC transporter substrate-binding protein [Sphingomicrobium nitratireducens]